MNGSTRRQVVVIAPTLTYSHTLTSRLKSIAQLAQDSRGECGFDGGERWRESGHGPVYNLIMWHIHKFKLLHRLASVPYCGSTVTNTNRRGEYSDLKSSRDSIAVRCL